MDQYVKRGVYELVWQLRDSNVAILATDLSQIPQLTRQAEVIGFEGIWVSETAHDAFLPLVLAAEHSQRLSLGTGLAMAFPRSPNHAEIR